jgi:hypothetical protein
MLTVLVIDGTGSQSTMLSTLATLGDIPAVCEIIAVSTDEKPQEPHSATWITGATIMEGLSQAITVAASKRIIIINSALTFDTGDLSRFAAEVEVSPLIEHIYLPPISADGVAELPSLTPDTIIHSLSRNDTWPLLCLATTRSALRKQLERAAGSLTEFLLTCCIEAISSAEVIRRSSVNSPLIAPHILRALCELSPEERGRALKVAVDTINIEELFPNHAWNEFSQESAAAAYHSLAALFIQFGDMTSAEEALRCSESLEESPRYFALQGLLSHKKGETLGAVANMVSSLQCYESRKVNDGKHYLTFTPKNLEIINSRLVDGLNALNKRENDKAMTHFSEAVFNFDSFYGEHGVQLLEKFKN